MKHVLVTGGAGFIGSHVADAFIARGDRVTIVDNLSSGDRRNINPKADFIEADIREFDLRSLRPDIVSHHAAQMDVRRSVADPLFDASVNVLGSIHLLQQSVDAGVKRFIFASTGGAIYGEPEYVPQDENHPLRPMSPYGCAKLAVEYYMNYYRQVHGLKTVPLRYANVYGPRQNAHGEAGVVAIFAQRMLAGQPVTINGDGEQTRDFVYVADVVAANMAVADTEEPGPFNVGTGVETSVNELYLMMRKLIPGAPEATHAEAKVGEQRRSVLAAKLRTADVAMVDGLERTVAWFAR